MIVAETFMSKSSAIIFLTVLPSTFRSSAIMFSPNSLLAKTTFHTFSTFSDVQGDDGHPAALAHVSWHLISSRTFAYSTFEVVMVYLYFGGTCCHDIWNQNETSVIIIHFNMLMHPEFCTIIQDTPMRSTWTSEWLQARSCLTSFHCTKLLGACALKVSVILCGKYTVIGSCGIYKCMG